LEGGKKEVRESW